jgi:hypothetical protein
MGVGDRQVLLDLIDHGETGVADDLGHQGRLHPPAQLLRDKEWRKRWG